jgi:hypothetical protein
VLGDGCETIVEGLDDIATEDMTLEFIIDSKINKWIIAKK